MWQVKTSHTGDLTDVVLVYLFSHSIEGPTVHKTGSGSCGDTPDAEVVARV